METANTLTPQAVRAARERIGRYIRRTPLLDSEGLSRQLGCQAYLKAEMLQRTGSFKLRGALNKALQLTPEELGRGLVASSAGNHAQGLAYAGRLLGARTVIVMPSTAPQQKIDNTRALGGQVILFEGRQVDRIAYMERLVREKGYTLVHASEDPQVMAGQGTIALEILEDLPDVDTIVVPLGGGGLISGIAVAAKAQNPRIRVVGVEPAAAPKYHESRREGHPVVIPAGTTLADGIREEVTGKNAYPLVERYVDELVLAGEAAIAQALRLLCADAKLAAEGAAVVGLAALLEGAFQVRPDEKVCFVLSGGNWEPARLAPVYAGADHL